MSAYAQSSSSHATLATWAAWAAGEQCEESRVETGLAGRDPRPRMGQHSEAACPGMHGAKVFANLGTGSLLCPRIGCGGSWQGTEAGMLVPVPCQHEGFCSGFMTNSSTAQEGIHWFSKQQSCPSGGWGTQVLITLRVQRRRPAKRYPIATKCCIQLVNK